MPRLDQFTFLGGKYDPAAFGIGFFAALAVAADDVEIHLNGFTLKQGVEHNLMQRFFALIELGSTPFLSGQGPHDFGYFVAPRNVLIKYGTLGLSSHHAIHGNLAQNVLIEDVVMENWAVAAIAINGGRNVRVKNVRAGPNFKESPVSSVFSTAQFMHRYVQALRSCPHATELKGRPTIAEIDEQLSSVIENTYQAVVVSGDRQRVPELVRSRDGLVDGNVYGLLFNVMGVAVNGLFDGNASEKLGNSDISLEHVKIVDVSANVEEIVALATPENELAPEVDPVGSLFQVLQVTATCGSYAGNVVSDAQLVVAKNIIHSGNACFSQSRLSTKRNTISEQTILWAEAGNNGSLEQREYLCGGDALFHLNKGVFGLRLDGAMRSELNQVSVSNISNTGGAQHSICAESVLRGKHPGSTEELYQGSSARGLVMSSVHQLKLRSVELDGVESMLGAATGVELLFQSSEVSGTARVGHIQSYKSFQESIASKVAASVWNSKLTIVTT